MECSDRAREQRVGPWGGPSGLGRERAGFASAPGAGAMAGDDPVDEAEGEAADEVTLFHNL